MSPQTHAKEQSLCWWYLFILVSLCSVMAFVRRKVPSQKVFVGSRFKRTGNYNPTHKVGDLRFDLSDLRAQLPGRESEGMLIQTQSEEFSQGISSYFKKYFKNTNTYEHVSSAEIILKEISQSRTKTPEKCGLVSNYLCMFTPQCNPKWPRCCNTVPRPGF